MDGINASYASLHDSADNSEMHMLTTRPAFLLAAVPAGSGARGWGLGVGFEGSGFRV